MVAPLGDLADAQPLQGGIRDAEASDEDTLSVFGIGGGQILRPDETFADEDDSQNNPHDAQRIGQRATQGGAAGIEPQLHEGLLGGTQRRRVGGRTAENARHVGQRDAAECPHGHGQQRSGEDHPHSDGQHRRTAGAHRGEESRADLKPQRIDEENQSEALGIGEHARIDAQSDVSGQNADEKYERHPQRDPADADLPQQDARRGDQREDDDGLNGRMFGEKRN